MRKYKQFIIGFIVGAMLFSIIPASAAIEEYICYKADYKVMINGEEYISPDLPVLNYKGNTYAPFRSILEAAGLNVNWNTELNQAEVTSSKEVNAISPSSKIEYDYNTKLPIGAEIVEFKDCKNAVKYNDKIYLSLGDLSSKFGVKSVFLNVKDRTETFMKNDKIVIVDLKASDHGFLNSLGTPYYNIDLFAELIGE